MLNCELSPIKQYYNSIILQLHYIIITILILLFLIVPIKRETLQHYKYFFEVASLLTWVRSVVFKKPARKRRWVSFLSMKERLQAKVPPEALSTRWNTWFEAVKYHAEHVHLYRDSRKFIIPGSHKHPQPAGNRGEDAGPHRQADLHLQKLLQTDDGSDNPGRNPPSHSSFFAHNVMGDLESYLVNGMAKM